MHSFLQLLKLITVDCLNLLFNISLCLDGILVCWYQSASPINLQLMRFLSAEITGARNANGKESLGCLGDVETAASPCYQVSHAYSHANQSVPQLLLQDHWQTAHQLTGHHLSQKSYPNDNLAPASSHS